MRKIGLRFALLFSVTAIGCLPLCADETNVTLTLDGVTYSNVTFETVTPYAVSIRHEHGIASVPLEKLSPELQKRFGYDANKAAQYHTAELQAQQAEAERLRRIKEQQDADVRASQHAQQFTRDGVPLSGNVKNVIAAGVIMFAQMGTLQIFPDGSSNLLFSKSRVQVLLTGYPNTSNLASGDKIMCEATRDGTFTLNKKTVVQRWVWIRDKPNGWSNVAPAN
jgi:(2Fe-2S) ferredoxin